MKALVTGGGGFVGSRIARMLVERGDDVTVLARRDTPALLATGARVARGDLRDPTALTAAVTGQDVVFHVASKTGYWGDPAEFVETNVEGTRRLLDAARRAGVGRFAYTSTPSVIGYGHDADGITDAPYPSTFESAYAETKAAAEQLVLAAHGASFATVSLRPHLVIGPGDNHLLPRVIARARAGRLRIVGDGDNRVDLTYVDNAAGAHLDAVDALPGPAGGRAFFISNDEPVALWPWTNGVLRAVGAPEVTRKVSLSTAKALGAVLESAWRWLPLPGEPPMTRFLALALARSHWYDMGPAREAFGYRVRVGLADGTERTVAWLRSSSTG